MTHGKTPLYKANRMLVKNARARFSPNTRSTKNVRVLPQHSMHPRFFLVIKQHSTAPPAFREALPSASEIAPISILKSYITKSPGYNICRIFKSSGRRHKHIARHVVFTVIYIMICICSVKTTNPHPPLFSVAI